MTKTTYKQIDLAGWEKVGEGGNGSVYTCPENMETFLSDCKRFAALDIIMLGHIQTLNWHERLFLSLLVRSLI